MRSAETRSGRKLRPAAASTSWQNDGTVRRHRDSSKSGYFKVRHLTAIVQTPGTFFLRKDFR